MADVTPSKNNLQQEEVDFKSALSEQLMTKIAGSVNFINDRQFCTFKFDFLGKFKVISGGEDGAVIMPMDVEICAISFRLRDTGSAGSTSFNLRRVNTDGSQTTLFDLFSSTAIPATETNEKGFYRNYITGTYSLPGGLTTSFPISDANRLIDAGQGIRIDLIENATDAQDLSITIFYRPR